MNVTDIGFNYFYLLLKILLDIQRMKINVKHLCIF